MKRNETPLNASIFLDAFCSPITLTGNHALPVKSHPWLRNNFFGKTKASALVNYSFPLWKVYPDIIT